MEVKRKTKQKKKNVMVTKFLLYGRKSRSGEMRSAAGEGREAEGGWHEVMNGGKFSSV